MRAIVTGAARGLGAAVAGRLARDSADVVLLDVSADVAAMAERLARWNGGGDVDDSSRPPHRDQCGLVADALEPSAHDNASQAGDASHLTGAAVPVAGGVTAI